MFTQKIAKKYRIVILVALLIALFVGVLVLYNSKEALLRDLEAWRGQRVFIPKFVERIIPGPSTERAQVRIEAPGTEVKVGEEQTLTVILDPQDHIVAGVDIVIRYDPQKVVIDEAQQIVESSYIPDPMIDNTLGMLKMSVLFNPGTVIEGEMQIATIVWTALQAGTVDFTLDFTPGILTDSNVAELVTGHDVLGTVINAKVTVKENEE